MHLGSRRRLLAAVGCCALAAVGVPAPSGARTNVLLTVQLAPGTVSAGQAALAVATFQNVGATPLPNVVVDLRFPRGLSVSGTPHGCHRPGGSSVAVVCSLGDVPRGATRHAYVTARVAKSLGGVKRVRVQFALRVGAGLPAPILTGASARVLASNDASNRGSCRAVPRTITATLDHQITALPSPPKADPALRAPCTPLSVGVDPPPAGPYKTKEATVGLPALVRPAIVKLTFANEQLPDESLEDDIPPGRTPSFDNPNPLWVLNPDGRRFVVPRCLTGNRFPAGWHSCILRVHAIDVNGDLDRGWIKLLVQGQGYGDPRFVG
jgi:hypothetical protein